MAVILVLSLPSLQTNISAQTPGNSVVSPSRRIANIPADCDAVDLDQEGNLFLLSTSQHQVHKLFAATGFDSVLTIGGKGIGSEGFNTPVKIEVQNRQSAFVLDFNNRRILTLNVNLKVVKEINFLDLQDQLFKSGESVTIFPISFAVGPSGELYLLNQDDIKIYKLNIFGEFETVFGGTDYGEGSLTDPDDIALNEGNFLFVSDTVEQKISVFDLYGTYQYAIYPEASFRWKGMAVAGQMLLCYSDTQIFAKNLFSKKYTEMKVAGPVLDLDASPDKIYVLTGVEVQVFDFRR